MSETEQATLRAYLAERDAPCAACGYNLRGTQDPVCPECGGPVELTLGRRQSGPWVLLLVLLLCVGLGAGVDAGRAAWSAADQSRVSQRQIFSFRGGTTIQLGTSVSARTFVLNSGSPTVVTSPSTTGVTIGSTLPSGGTSAVTGSVTAPGSVTLSRPLTVRPASPLRTAGAVPTRDWSLVPWQTWLGLGGWGALCLLALGVAALVLIWRRRLVREGAGATLLGAGVGLAAVQLGVHLFLFAREVFG